MLNITYKKTKDLKGYEKNPRTHPEEQIEKIVRSMKEFSWTNPILIDEHDGIIAGHGRLEAAKRLEMKEVPCIVLSGLSEDKKAALVIADNKLALGSSWDNDLLVDQFNFLKEFDYDLTLTGFDEEELLRFETPDFEPSTIEEQGKLDEIDPKYIDCPHCGKEFDIRDKK